MSVEFLYQNIKMKNIKGIGSLKRKCNNKIRESLLDLPRQQMNQCSDYSSFRKIYTVVLSGNNKVVNMY